MKKLFLALTMTLAGCSVNAIKLNKDYVQDFANKVSCATGPSGVCFCFVASRTTGSRDSSGMAMSIDHTGKLCER